MKSDALQRIKDARANKAAAALVGGAGAVAAAPAASSDEIEIGTESSDKCKSVEVNLNAVKFNPFSDVYTEQDREKLSMIEHLAHALESAQLAHAMRKRAQEAEELNILMEKSNAGDLLTDTGPGPAMKSGKANKSGLHTSFTAAMGGAGAAGNSGAGT